MMKKVLFATTALIATAGVASADVTVGGYGFLGITYNGTDIDVARATRLTFAGSVETDSGIAFTASSRITVANGTAATHLERGKITMTSGGLTLAAGATNGAMKSLARVASYQGFNDGGVIGFDTNTSGINDSGNNVYLSYAMGDLVVGIGSDAAGNEHDIAVRYTVNSFTIGAGVSSNDEWMVSGSLKSGAVSAAIGYNSDETAVLSVGYAISDATSLSLAVQNAAAGTSYGVSVSQDLGGASLTGTLGQNAAGTTLAGLGVMFSF
jgi:outer membrane protein OmpU